MGKISTAPHLNSSLSTQQYRVFFLLSSANLSASVVSRTYLLLHESTNGFRATLRLKAEPKLGPASVRVISVTYELQGSSSKDIFQITIYSFLCLVSRPFKSKGYVPLIHSYCRGHTARRLPYTAFAVEDMHCKS